MSTLNMDAVPDGWDWSQGPPPEIFMDAPPSSENGESPGETSAQEVETSTQGANPCKKPAAQQKPPDWVVEQFGLDGTESQEDAPAWVQAMFIDNEDSVQEPCVEVEAPSTVVEEEDDTDDSTMVIEESDNWFISMMCGLLGIMCGDS